MFSRVSLKTKMTLTVLMSCLLCSLSALTISYFANQLQLQDGIIGKSRTILSRLDKARSFVATQGGLKQTMELIVSKYNSDSQLTEQDKSDIMKQVPIVASMKIGSDEADKEFYQFRIFSDEPRRKENQANTEEMKIFRQFEMDPNLKEIVTNDGKVLSVFKPVYLKEKEGCLICHGSPEKSPWKNGKDILGFKMENWKDGKLHGVFGIISNISVVSKAQTEGQFFTPTMMLLVGIIIATLFSLTFGYSISHKICNTFNVISRTISERAVEVTRVANAVSDAGIKLNDITSKQASALQQTSSAVEQTNAMVNKNSENAKRSREISIESKSTVEKGTKAVVEVITSIEQIANGNEKIVNQIQESNKEIGEIVTLISEIGNKTKVINDIVFQTKLLSFNASVEAARAGEHGKGFSVVAEEVGNLAHMSGNSAKEITQLLESSINRVNEIVNNTKQRVERHIMEGKARIQEGTKTANACGTILTIIVDQVSEVTEKVNEISIASEEQSRGISEINKAMGELDSSGQVNRSQTAQLTSEAEFLKTQADELKKLIQELDGYVDGQTHKDDSIAS
ncbi:MAG: methyl-accepting chemotaxis protein [Bdellovibrionaceae bacterium]|nr:methyl-accepting chemotaxis protein [Pseudobdellovibrionaceae bacterium]NUM58638.1 DUF3365 domain-containing protein [Pseudobdellovibrionaceae bacterium]